jgi:hypothetical protein
MLKIFKSLRGQQHRSMQERRQHPRHACRITVHYLMQGSWYGGSIRGISEGGVYVRSTQRAKFSKGEPILMVANLRVLRDQSGAKSSGLAQTVLELPSTPQNLSIVR